MKGLWAASSLALTLLMFSCFSTASSLQMQMQAERERQLSAALNGFVIDEPADVGFSVRVQSGSLRFHRITRDPVFINDFQDPRFNPARDGFRNNPARDGFTDNPARGRFMINAPIRR